MGKEVVKLQAEVSGLPSCALPPPSLLQHVIANTFHPRDFSMYIANMIFYKLCDHPLIKKVTSNLFVPPQLFFQLSSHSLALGVGTIRLHIKCGLLQTLQ